jgi:hypothetical protein
MRRVQQDPASTTFQHSTIENVARSGRGRGFLFCGVGTTGSFLVAATEKNVMCLGIERDGPSPYMYLTSATFVYLSGESSWKMFTTPDIPSPLSRHVKKTSPVPAS